MNLSKKKPVNQVESPKPLLPRTVAPGKSGLSFENFMVQYIAEHPYAQLGGEESANFNAYDRKIQYLIDTVEDMPSKKKEIGELWNLVIDKLVPESDRIMVQDGVYYHNLISLTGEAVYDIEDRQKFMNRLESAVEDRIIFQLRSEADAAGVINDLNRWLSRETLYLNYLGIGRSFSEVGYLKKLYEDFTPQFEAIKQSFPAVYINFVAAFKRAYQAVPSDYQVKFRVFLQYLALQAVLLLRNAGFFDDYDKVLKDYYDLKLRDKRLLHWAYQFFTGYGEQPWRLVLLLLGVNLIFALLFALLPLEFSGIDLKSYWLSRLGNFVYFNNTSMLTIGYGDIYPKDPFSKSLVFLLQLSGFSISSAAVALFLRRILRF